LLLVERVIKIEENKPFNTLCEEDFCRGSLQSSLLPYFPELKAGGKTNKTDPYRYNLDMLTRSVWSICDLQIYIKDCDPDHPLMPKLMEKVSRGRGFGFSLEPIESLTQLLLMRNYQKAVILIKEGLAQLAKKMDKDPRLSKEEAWNMYEMRKFLFYASVTDKTKKSISKQYLFQIQ
jgi:hypothetical protein